MSGSKQLVQVITQGQMGRGGVKGVIEAELPDDSSEMELLLDIQWATKPLQCFVH